MSRIGRLVASLRADWLRVTVVLLGLHAIASTLGLTVHLDVRPSETTSSQTWQRLAAEGPTQFVRVTKYPEHAHLAIHLAAVGIRIVDLDLAQRYFDGPGACAGGCPYTSWGEVRSALDDLRGEVSFIDSDTTRDARRLRDEIGRIEQRLRQADQAAQTSQTAIQETDARGRKTETDLRELRFEFERLRTRIESVCNSANSYYAEYATVTIPSGPLAGQRVSVHNNFAAAFSQGLCR